MSRKIRARSLLDTERRVTPCSDYTSGCHPSHSRSERQRQPPVGRDYLRVPNEKQQNVQRQEGDGSPSPGRLSVDVTFSRSFHTFQLVHCPPNSSRGTDGSQLTAEVRIFLASGLAEETDARWTTPRHRSHGACHIRPGVLFEQSFSSTGKRVS